MEYTSISIPNLALEVVDYDRDLWGGFDVLVLERRGHTSAADVEIFAVEFISPARHRAGTALRQSRFWRDAGF